MIDCLQNLYQGLNGDEAETTAADNLKSMALVEAAYQSAASGQVVAPADLFAKANP
jgi:predicted dehydrogenase